MCAKSLRTCPPTVPAALHHAQMASSHVAASPDPPSVTVADLVAFTKSELDADAERQAQVAEVHHAQQTGATLDLSHKSIHALPVEVIALIKDKVERCVSCAPPAASPRSADGARMC